MSAHSPAPRPPGRRFPRCAPGTPGYDVAEVDAFLSEVEAALGGADPVNAHPVGAGPVDAGAEGTDPEGGRPAGADRVDADPAGAGPAGAGSRGVTSAQVRSAVFSGARGGYRTEVVDEALEAAEDALAAAEREQFLRARGPEAWQRRVDELGDLVRGRLGRPRTQRFRHPSRARARGYSAAHVDVLCDRLAEHLDGRAALDAAELRHAAFPPAQGELGYEEQQVDAFLDRAVELILALR